jgi:bifunctional non-homologous end joining protein LigD
LKEMIEWVRPSVVARVKYGNWTDANRLRAPVFLALRDDVPATACTMAAARRDEAPADESVVESTELTEFGDIGDAETTEPRKRQRTAQKPAKLTPIAPRQEIDKVEPRSEMVVRAGKSAESMVSENIEEEIREGSAEKLNVQVDGKVLHFTHLNKIYFPESGIRKRDLLAYYFRVGSLMLPFLKDRPMVLRRYPNGIGEKAFFQKEATESIPDWLDRAIVYSDERGVDMPYVMANDLAALLYLTNLGCIDHNPWSSRAESQGCPDYVFFDLDPTPGTPFSTVLQIARTIHQILDAIRLTCFLKTSGASGFHIFVPLKPEYTYEQTRVFAELVGRMAAEELPGLITFERMVKKRPSGKVLMDALQNARGKPLATVYSARAYPGAPVSTPVIPAELKKDISADQWTIRTLDKRLKSVGDLWKDFWKKRQSLAEAVDMLERRLSRGKSKAKRETDTRHQ